MSLTNTDEEYGAVARLLHWATAFLIFGLIPVGLYMTSMAYGPEKLEIYVLHKSFGFLALFIVIVRLAWRVLSIPPEHLMTHAGWERTLAGMTHAFLYLAVIGMPVSGWLMSSAGEYPVPFFGIDMPDLIGKNEAIYKTAGMVHEYLAFGLIGAVGLHVAGALKHHLIDKDTTLMRMTFMKGPMGTALIAVLIIAFFSAVGYLLVKPKEESRGPVSAPVPAASLSVDEATLAALPPHGWAIVPGNSSIEFQGSMGGTAFTGKFEDFAGSIVFNPDDLAHSKATIIIQTASATTSNAERDQQIGAAEWFATEQWPEAKFETITFERTADNFIAVGNLTIRDVTLPVTMPFTITFGTNDKGQKTALMQGRAQLNRLDYGIGQGQWANESTVANPVSVAVRISALQP